MKSVINAKQLFGSLPSVVRRVRGGERITVVYHRQPVFLIVPVETIRASDTPLEADSLYRAEAVGRSRDGRSAPDQDSSLYSS